MKRTFFLIFVMSGLFSCIPSKQENSGKDSKSNSYQTREIASDSKRCLEDLEDKEDSLNFEINGLKKEAQQISSVLGHSEIDDALVECGNLNELSLCEDLKDLSSEIVSNEKKLEVVEDQKALCLVAQVKVLCPGSRFPAGIIDFVAKEVAIGTNSQFNPSNGKFEAIRTGPFISYSSVTSANTSYGGTIIPSCHYTQADRRSRFVIRLDSQIYTNCRTIKEGERPGFLCDKK